MIDLGNGYSCRWVGWSPDRVLNPQYDGIPDEPHFGIILTCPHGDGMIHVNNKSLRMLSDLGSINSVWWEMVSEEPLTLTPSIARRECGCHGFITDGKWVPA